MLSTAIGAEMISTPMAARTQQTEVLQIINAALAAAAAGQHPAAGQWSKPGQGAAPAA